MTDDRPRKCYFTVHLIQPITTMNHNVMLRVIWVRYVIPKVIWIHCVTISIMLHLVIWVHYVNTFLSSCPTSSVTSVVCVVCGSVCLHYRSARSSILSSLSSWSWLAETDSSSTPCRVRNDRDPIAAAVDRRGLRMMMVVVGWIVHQTHYWEPARERDYPQWCPQVTCFQCSLKTWTNQRWDCPLRCLPHVWLKTFAITWIIIPFVISPYRS